MAVKSTAADKTSPATDNRRSFKSLTATVASALQLDLVAGRYMPGAKLPIVQLAKDYGVSPGAVREALSRLISEGLVEFNEQRGFRAAPVSQAALVDITRTRILTDVHALREAIRLGESTGRRKSSRSIIASANAGHATRPIRQGARRMAAAAPRLPPHADLRLRLRMADAISRSPVRPDDPLPLDRLGLRDDAQRSAPRSECRACRDREGDGRARCRHRGRSCSSATIRARRTACWPDRAG